MRKKTTPWKKSHCSWLCIELPMSAPESPVSVIELTPGDDVRVTPAHAVDPDLGVTISTLFAQAANGHAYKKYWMEKFGEWKTAYVVDGWTDETTVTWNLDIKDPGYYLVELNYSGDGRMVWAVESDEGRKIQNQQGASQAYNSHPIGWMEFANAGPHTLKVRLLEGNRNSVSLQKIGVKRVAL